MQWTSKERKAALWDYAKKAKTNVADLETQVKFAIKEMKAAGFGPGWGKKAKSLGDAVKIFLNRYEGINNGTADDRTKIAKKIYAKYF